MGLRWASAGLGEAQFCFFSLLWDTPSRPPSSWHLARRKRDLLDQTYLDIGTCPGIPSGENGVTLSSSLVILFPAPLQLIWKLPFGFCLGPWKPRWKYRNVRKRQLSLCDEWLSALASESEVLVLTQCLLPETLAGHQALIHCREIQGIPAVSLAARLPGFQYCSGKSIENV